MDRALQANVITKSGKAVETAGDLDTLLLDKTGTITIGNRKATHFWPAPGIEEKVFMDACVLASLADETPEGKSIVELAGASPSGFQTSGAKFVKFTAETRCSGIDLPGKNNSKGDLPLVTEGLKIRKGAFDAIRTLVIRAGNSFPMATETKIKEIASNGGTPLAVSRMGLRLG
jgi:K+-transporting ATPase ATPase B chain